jgi:hypothetical protein
VSEDGHPGVFRAVVVLNDQVALPLEPISKTLIKRKDSSNCLQRPPNQIQQHQNPHKERITHTFLTFLNIKKFLEKIHT